MVQYIFFGFLITLGFGYGVSAAEISIEDFSLDRKSLTDTVVTITGHAACDSDHCELISEVNRSLTVSFSSKLLPRRVRTKMIECPVDLDPLCTLTVTGVVNREFPDVNLLELGKKVEAVGQAAAIENLQEEAYDLKDVSTVKIR